MVLIVAGHVKQLIHHLDGAVVISFGVKGALKLLNFANFKIKHLKTLTQAKLKQQQAASLF